MSFQYWKFGEMGSSVSLYAEFDLEKRVSVSGKIGERKRVEVYRSGDIDQATDWISIQNRLHKFLKELFGPIEMQKRLDSSLDLKISSSQLEVDGRAFDVAQVAFIEGAGDGYLADDSSSDEGALELAVIDLLKVAKAKQLHIRV